MAQLPAKGKAVDIETIARRAAANIATGHADVNSPQPATPELLACASGTRKGVVALDIETTGASLQHDECFAIGVAVVDRPLGQPPRTLETYKLLLRMPRLAGESWQAMWARCRFEQRCFDEFWSKPDNLRVLERLQNIEGAQYASSQDALGVRLSALLGDLERRYTAVGVDLVLVTDTIHYDPVWLNYLLSRANLGSLLYYRSGKYGIDSFEYNTYVCATLAAKLGVSVEALDWAAQVRPFKDRIAKRVGASVVHDHDPEHDAESIAHKFLLVCDTPWLVDQQQQQ
jgi:hypothetical protein